MAEKIETTLQEQIQQTEVQLLSQIEQVQTSLNQQANQVQSDLAAQMDNQHQQFQGLMTAQDQYLKKVRHQFLLVKKLPLTFSIILCCLLLLSLGVNPTVLFKWGIWSNFMIAMIGIMVFILVVWGIYLAYQNIQNQED
ncbi:hypothetical protein ACGTJS_04860 [Faucicola mancuniensis]|uniref:hypothetical protein n=1 Tax=Faucicola mancuniensis TaxID=1309795 RepID=UPI0039779704